MPRELAPIPAGLVVLSLFLVLWAGSRPLDAAPGADEGNAKSLVTNGGFEDGSGMLPDGWVRGAAVPGVEYLWDRSQAKSGSACLCLKKTAPQYFPLAQVTQAVPGRVPDQVKISAWVKAQGVTKATVDVQWEVDGERRHQWAVYIGAQEAGDPPADHDWQRVEGVVDPGPRATKLRLAFQIYGPGTVWFDDVQASAVMGAEPAVAPSGTRESPGGAPSPPAASTPKAAAVPINPLEELRKRVEDPSLARQISGFRDLLPYAFQDFAEDYTAYREWHARYRDVPEITIIRENCLAFLERLKKAAGAERARMARFLERSFRDMFRTSTAVEVGRQSGLLEVAAAWLTDPTATMEMARAAAQIIRRLDPGEAYLRQVVLPVARQSRSEEVRASAFGVLGRPENAWAIDPLLETLVAQLEAEGDDFRFIPPAEALQAIGDPRVIPTMIAVIEADDTHASIYGVGYFGLSQLTGVAYDETHDGRWWRSWWEKNRERFPEAVRSLTIPELKKQPARQSRRGARPAEGATGPCGMGEEGEGLDALLRTLTRQVTTHDLGRLQGTASKIQALKDPRAIPTLIACLRFDDTQDTHYGIGHFGLSGLTGVRYDESHDGEWWRHWWERNRERFGPQVARLEIPRLKPSPVAPREGPPDPRVAGLKEHAIPVRSIQPDDEDFSDLMPLARKIGRARIVLLGEQSHGDGATFLAKCRLVRFLHQKLGFDVLAWESGLYDCHRMEAALHTNLPLRDAVQQGIFPIWSRSGHVLPVFDYARKTHSTRRPLEMAGFDCQFSGAGGGETFVRALFQLLARLDPAAELDGERRMLLQWVKRLSEPEYAPPEDERERGRKTILSLRDRLTRAQSREKILSREAAFYAQALRSLITLEAMRARPHTGSPSDTNLRDRQMAENLLWLARKHYPGRKIIVWAASFHLARNLPQVEVPDGSLDYRTTVPMGHTVHEKLDEQVYTIAFTAYSGTRGNPFHGASRLEAAEPGSLEELCHRTGQPYFLVDLRGAPRSHWLREKLPARPLGYHPMRAAWGKVFDAIFFTDAMFASSESGRVPAWARQASRIGK